MYVCSNGPDPHHFDSDRDPEGHFEADWDPTFHFDADADSDPDPSF